MHIRNISLVALAFAAVVFVQDCAADSNDSGFQVHYAANLNIGESYINITNTGANGAPLLGPIIFGNNTATGNICVNIYAFDPAEELISCCSCLVTPDQTVNLGVVKDLTSQTLTAETPASATVELVATLAGTGGSGTSCQYSAGIGGTIVNGIAAWSTTLHGTGPYPGSTQYVTTETRFTVSTPSTAHLASIVGRCGFIIGNSGGHGICSSCSNGALGGQQQL
jgi:hypothetical protein